MKAVLVIDIPEDYTGSVISVNLYGRNNRVIHEIHTNKLRPLPQFEEEAIPYQVSETEVDCYQDPYAAGFNDAIRLITGETE